jgi:hypothetical protein
VFMAFSCIVLAFGVVLIGDSVGVLAAFVLVAIGVPLLLWRPIGVVYTLGAGAVLFETYQLRYPDSLTDTVPFFRAVDSVGGLPIALNVAELLMFGTLGLIMANRLLHLRPPLSVGRLWVPMAAFGFVLMFGVVHGMSTGGDLNIIAYEIRGLLYLILGYLLVVNLVKSSAQVKGLFWVLLLGIAFKGVLGSWRYAVTLNGDLSRTSILSTTNSLMAHEESYMFAFFLAFIAVAWLLRAHRTQLLFALALVLPVALSFLANQRRASVLVLLLALLLIAALVYVTTRWRRGLIAVVAIACLVVMPLYVVSLSDAEGLIAEPASAFASVYRPDERDQSSNRYRDLENENLRLNIASHPLIGDGFGKPIPLFVPVPDLSEIASLWAFIPHNTVLWVWHRLGFIGFVAFWFLAGRLIIAGFHAAKSFNDGYFKLVAVMSVVAFAGWIVLGLLDQGLTSFRPSLVVGLMAGMLSVMHGLDPSPQKAVKDRGAQGGAA